MPEADLTADQIPVNILLVDDRPENLQAMTALLGDNKAWHLTQARSGEEALRLLLAREFAVILLDVQMPGLDGFDTAAVIRERRKNQDTPIIFITAVDKNRESMLKGYALGAVDYLFKPVEPAFLKAKVAVFAELFRKRLAESLARNLLDAQAQELQRSNRDLEQFAYVASHDLQEPLRKIRSFAELLASRYQGRLDTKADEFIHYITDGTRRMQQLIDGLLTYSRVSTQGRPLTLTDFNTLVAGVLEQIDMGIREARATVLTDPLPTLGVDPGQMAQVFQNLLLNAVKFRGRAEPRIRIMAEKMTDNGREGFRFEVQDNGIGLPEGQTERIFDLFQRLHPRDRYPGEGLGLAICKKIVERHKGRIWAESQGRGCGTSFFFFLPEQTADLCQEGE